LPHTLIFAAALRHRSKEATAPHVTSYRFRRPLVRCASYRQLLATANTPRPPVQKSTRTHKGPLQSRTAGPHDKMISASRITIGPGWKRAILDDISDIIDYASRRFIA
jgi:hypothetical protein